MRSSARLEVTGLVQGVGFRPFVHRLATELGLVGHVQNSTEGATIRVAGSAVRLAEFAERLASEAPPLARIESVIRSESRFEGADSFEIVASAEGPAAGLSTSVPPDTATCSDCVRELFDPLDRRHRHPFITCTNCGPRFTIIQSLPYDRERTTMSPFPMCGTCRSEYGDLADRRHHAQPISCHDCGPRLSFRRLTGVEPVSTKATPDPVAEARRALAAGDIVAVKGIGGYHLVCDATNDEAVAELRRRKLRPDQPLAVMVKDVAHAGELTHLNDLALEQLTSMQRPIVIVPAKESNDVSAGVAPNTPLVGVMLPYSPVHHLLFEESASPLVVTSANRTGEPIIFDDDDARAKLGALSDGVLAHDRPIHVPAEDSVVRVDQATAIPIRRARGYAPAPVPLPGSTHPTLAVGGDLKNTFCFSSSGRAWLSPHIGGLANYDVLSAFEHMVDHYQTLFGVDAELLVTDLHPGYQSSAWTKAKGRERYPGAEVHQVQHHYAHVGAVMAEHQMHPDETALGFAFDGTGYGSDGSIWGGEVLLAEEGLFRRVAHLAPVPLAGGDAAVREPYRLALAHMANAEIDWTPDLPPLRHVDGRTLVNLERQLTTGLACVPTTSMGRLFDAVASLIGLRHEITFEAQAAIELEMVAFAHADYAADVDQCQAGPYAFALSDGIFDPTPVLRAIVQDLDRDVSVRSISFGFHQSVADLVTRVAETIVSDRTTPVVLAGGVFQNALLLRLSREQLQSAGFRVLTAMSVPPNDGGLALGQAYVANQPAANQPTANQLAAIPQHPRR